MHNFKVNDEAWYFTFPENGCGGFDVSAIDLNCDKVSKTNYLYEYLNYCYKSKEEAINAIRARINELENNCST